MTRQLVFDLPLREARGREDFFVSPANAIALAALDAWQGWPGGKAVLTGPSGSGKTHLAHVWATATEATVIAAADLTEAALPGLAGAALVVENADRIAATGAEALLFHLHNLMASAGRPLLVTGTGAPRDWGLRLPDLASRLQAATMIRLDPPDDMLLRAVLSKQFTDRQVIVAPALIDWLAARMTRSLATAREVVAALDARALADGRPISRQMAADWLQGQDLFPED